MDGMVRRDDGCSIKTLNRLERLQTISANLPKDTVLAKVKNYLKLLGRRIDRIVLDNEEEPHGQDKMTKRLWNYVSTFSNLSGERLQDIYSKLILQQDEEVGPSHINGSASGPFGRDSDPTPFSRHVDRQRGYKNVTNYQSFELQKGHDTAKSEAWNEGGEEKLIVIYQFRPHLKELSAMVLGN
ncbi:unnamed protein product [Prunus armeniaca]|uniref:Chromodomain-helicase-DNA-binding protein 1-like C-terminal domain-containing protein n=1 Tax=Prunus armeniaca TaxID=36596 RepID=A0A6J5UR25_PRUAR|nr:unnamed protein product [Prunus armeniaca]